MKYACILAVVTLLQGGVKNISEYFRAFPYKGNFTLEESDKNEAEIDIPNAYIHIVQHGEEDYPFDSEMQFVYFVTASKEKIFGMSTIERGPNTDLFSYGFYKQENGKWIEVTNEVLPDLPFTVFAGEIPEAEEVGPNFQIEVTLPQKGTSLTIASHPVGDTDNPFGEQDNGLQKYLNLFTGMAHPEITLMWNREKGVFEVRE
jgi:hypothetical protein